MNHALAAALAVTLAVPLPAAAADDPVVVFRHELLAAAGDARRDAQAWKHWGEELAREIHQSLGSMFGERMGRGKVVKGAPYSAQVVTETHQSLADGNIISRQKSGAVHRDGEGRTRQETPAEGGENTVFINDPVVGTHYVVTPSAKRAVATKPKVLSFRNEFKDKQVVRLAGSEVRVEDGKVFIDGKEVGGERTEVKRGGRNILVEDGRITIDGHVIGRGEGARHVIVKRVESSDGVETEEVRVQAIPVPPVPPVAPVPPVPPMPLMPGAHTLRFESTAKLGKGVTTPLGMKDFDGVKAEGKSTVWTIPAGKIGNRNAIHVMSETWYSPDLQVTVYSRHNDPRTGETIYRLSGIRRGEPAPELFRVPDDYKVKSRDNG